MKNIKALFLTITLAIIASVSAQAQSTTVSNLLGTLNLGDAANKLYAQAQSGGLLTATNYAIEPYLTYAPHLKAGHTTGGGVLAVYNFNQYCAGGLGVDYLGQFSLVSGNVTIRYPINVGSKVDSFLLGPLAGLKPTLNQITVVPFALGGIGTPCSGSSTTVSTIEDVGGYIQYGNFWGGKLNTGICYGQWNNAGDYSGKRYHVFFGWSHGF